MHTDLYRKAFFRTSLFGAVMSILIGFYDVIFGTLWEALHIVLEFIELILDELVENLLVTNLQQTQLIVFYIMLAFGGVMAYFSYKVLAGITVFGYRTLRDDLKALKSGIASDWQSLSIADKILWISLFLIANYLASFLYM